MTKALNFVMMAILALFISLPTWSKAEAADLVIIPLINNVADRDDLGSIYYDRGIEATKNARDVDVLDSVEVDKALEKNLKAGVLPDEAALKAIADSTGAEFVVAMQIDEVSREDITMDNNMELDMIVRCKGYFASYNAATAKYKRSRIDDEERMPLSLGARYDMPGEKFANNVTTQFKRTLGVKKVSIEKPRISKSGLKGNAR